MWWKGSGIFFILLDMVASTVTRMKASRILPSAQIEAQRLNDRAKEIQVEAEALKPIMRLEDITVWEMDKAKETKKGVKTNSYWMASWREGNKVKNVHVGSCNKLDREGSFEVSQGTKGRSTGNQLVAMSPCSHNCPNAGVIDFR